MAGHSKEKWLSALFVLLIYFYGMALISSSTIYNYKNIRQDHHTKLDYGSHTYQRHPTMDKGLVSQYPIKYPAQFWCISESSD